MPSASSASGSRTPGQNGTDHGCYQRNQDAISAYSQKLEQEAANKGAGNAKQHIDPKAKPTPFHYLSGQPSGHQTDDQEQYEAHGNLPLFSVTAEASSRIPPNT